VTILTLCITGAEKYTVIADGTEISSSPINLFQLALEVWIAAFWIFDIEYSAALRNTCCFIEKVLLGKGGHVTAAVRKWSNRFNFLRSIHYCPSGQPPAPNNYTHLPTRRQIIQCNYHALGHKHCVVLSYTA